MKSFEELRLGPEVVAALAAEGIESPTPFQAAAIPVVLRGHDLLGRVGPGGGALVGYAAPLLERLQGNAGAPACLVLCPSHGQATRLARSTTRLCEATGHRAAALAPLWRRPAEADFLFVPPDGIRRLFDGTVGTDGVQAVVLHDGDGIAASVPNDHLEALLGGLPSDCQRVFCGLPFGPALQSMARRFTRRAATVPSPGVEEEGAAGKRGAKGRPGGGPSSRGRLLRCVTADGGRFEAALALVASLLREPAGSARETTEALRSSSRLTPLLRQRGPRHVLVFASSADQAADLGDFIEMHGFEVGRPGDADAPVWLSPGEDAAAREAVEAVGAPESVATVSSAPPAAPEAALLRHGAGGPAWVVAGTREMRHVETVAQEAGFALKRVEAPRRPDVSEAIDALAAEVSEAVRSPETIPYALLVEALAPDLAATEIAAAALALLHRERGADARDAVVAPPKAWVRLFLSCGERDEIGPREIVGAIASEAGVSGKEVGKIQLRDKHAIVEVAEPEAARVVKALNGITLGGRSLRVDYDRQREKRPATTGQAGARPRRPAPKGAKRPISRRPNSKRPPGKSPPGKRTGPTKSRTRPPAQSKRRS